MHRPISPSLTTNNISMDAMKARTFFTWAATLAAVGAFACPLSASDAEPQQPEAAKRAAAQKLDIPALLRSLKKGGAMYTESCMCDPDPACASSALEENLLLCAKGKLALENYAGCLVDLLEGYPPRFADEPDKVVEASELLRNTVITLLDAGAPVNGYGTRMNGVGSFQQILITPLHSAVRTGDVTLAKILLEADADPNAETRLGEDCRDRECFSEEVGRTPLEEARTPEMKALLKEYGATK